MSATFLVTGFEPFREHRTNSSWDALALLGKTWPDSIVARRLPVDHRAAHAQLRSALEELQPRAVLLTGLAKGRVFRMERLARRPPELETELETDALFGRWPWDEMQQALEASGVEAVHSDDAGRYVCECTYWSLLSYRGPAAPEFAAFLHVPHESEEHGIPRIARAVGQVVGNRHAQLSSGRLILNKSS
jgi:pyroglutamyl-peptidase